MRARFPIVFSLLLPLLSLGPACSASSVPRQRHTPRPAATTRLAHRIHAILAGPVAAQAHWGISVTTLDGRVLYQKNEGQLFAPASNTKLLTSSAALALLGPNTTILTRVIAADRPDPQGVVRGDVTLVGAGDPSMSGRAYPYVENGGFPNPPLGALAALADQLRQQGVRLIEGNIVGDDTAFPWEPYGTGWAWDDLQWGDGTATSALTVSDNVAILTVAPGANAGDPVTVAWKPDVAGSYYTIQNDAKTSVAGSQPSLGVDREVGSMTIRIYGTIPAAGAAHKLDLAIQDPARFAAIAFRQMLTARGIVVTGKAVAHHRLPVDTAIYEQSVLRPLAIPFGTGASAPAFLSALQLAPPVPPGAVVLASRTSVPLLEDMKVTLKVSQNLHAELYLRLLGSHFGTDGSIEEGTRVVRAFMQRAGALPQDFFFYDGSGMSPEDRIAPRALTALLRYIAAQPWGSEFRNLLPIGGVDGTLSDRFQTGPLHARVFAKTGTLEEVNTLSGYVTAKSGRTIVFSILCNGHMPEAKGITKTIDAIVGAIAATN